MLNRLSKHSSFIEGYLYSKIENLPILFEDKRKTETDITSMIKYANIPKAWLGVYETEQEYNEGIPRMDLVQSISQNLVFCLSMTYSKHSFEINVVPNKQYVKFIVKVKLAPRNMTLSDIEKALGYPVNIICE